MKFKMIHENYETGIYFIQDPDGYWLEIIPAYRDSKQHKY